MLLPDVSSCTIGSASEPMVHVSPSCFQPGVFTPDHNRRVNSCAFLEQQVRAADRGGASEFDLLVDLTHVRRFLALSRI